MDEELNLLDLLNVVRAKLKSIVFFSILAGVAAFLLCAFVLTPTYDSHVELILQNTSTSGSTSVNANDLTAAQKLANTYQHMLVNKKAAARIKEVYATDLTEEQILGMVSVSAVGSTELLNITVSSPDPYLSRDIANAYAFIAQSLLREYYPASTVSPFGSADISGTPSSPNITLYTLAGFVAGFALSAVMFILMDMFTNIIKSEQELSSKCDVAVIGSVPDFFSLKELNIPRSVRNANKKLTSGKAPTNAKLLTDYTILSPKSPFVVTESYNMIRTNLVFSMSTGNSRVIVISSSLPNECKSTTSVNLAISMAQTGAKVLLVEGDLRNPTLHRIFQKSNRKGLSRVLAGLDTLSNSITIGVRPGLDLLSGGPIPPNPSELLGSENMAKLLSKLGEVYDYVFIDSPPVNVVADAMLLAKNAAGIIMVARESRTKYADLNRALSKVKVTNCNLLGVVLTDSDRMSSGYGDYRYGYGYGQSTQQ